MIIVFKFGLTLVSFIASMLLARMLLHHQAFSYISNRGGRYGTIDGLRGFLAISVFFHHFIITWYWKNNGKWSRPPEDYFQNYGKVGIALFFMITGFLFVSKLIKENGNTDWIRLFESRVFRIFPLYIFALILITITVAFRSNFELNVDFISLVKQYLRWFGFHGGMINNYSETKIVIAGVDWTLKYEWLFYFSLPCIALLMKYGKFWVVGASFVSVLLFIFPISFGSISSVFFILFAVGGCSAYISNRFQGKINLVKSRMASISCLSLIVASLFYPYTLDLFHILLISVFFILVVLGNDMFGLFSLKQSVFLGEISYSIYLLHGIVLYMLFSVFNVVDLSKVELNIYSLFMPFICMLVVVISSMTFSLIENPSISFGRKYIFSGILKNWKINANKGN